MGKILRIEGVAGVLSRLDQQIKGVENRTRTKMATVAMLMKAQTLPITPIETGHLRGSWFSDTIDQKGELGVRVGFTGEASYATYVHERMEVYHEPPTQAKFLETALKNNAGQIREIIAGAARI